MTIAEKWGIGRPKAEDSLQEHIDYYVRQGYRVVSQTETSAQLVRPKRFSLLWAFLWTLVALVGFFVYLIYYVSKKDATVYLTVSDGRVATTR